jgi:DNA-binding NarL/FixJ family response regulator
MQAEISTKIASGAKAELGGGTKRSRVFVVDDNATFREGLAEVINAQADLSMCGEAATAENALERIGSLQPDVAVVDISLAGNKNGIELTKEIKERHPQLPVLVLTMHEESLYAESAFQAGAQGYITKRQSMQHFLAALRKLLPAS